MDSRIAAMERLVAQDPARRGIVRLVTWGSLERAAQLLLNAPADPAASAPPAAQALPAAQSLPAAEVLPAAQSLPAAPVQAPRVGIISGFYLPIPQVGETDGPPGAKAIGRALEALGRHVLYLTDAVNAPLFSALGLGNVRVWGEAGPDGQGSSPLTVEALGLTHLIATERPGRAQDGRYYTMAARDITAFTPPLDELFLAARRRGLPTIAIGDGGNEIGMGNVLEQVRRDVRHGAVIGCVVPCDELIVAGVSNWGAYALAGALQVLSGRPVLLSPSQAEDDIRAVVAAGGADGHTFRNEPTVDGQSLADNLLLLERLHALAAG